MQAYLELYKYLGTKCLTVLHWQAHEQLVLKYRPYLYSFLVCYRVKLREKLKVCNKLFFYRILDLLHLVIKCLQYLTIIFFCFFLSSDTNMSKLMNKLLLCIYQRMNGTMFQIRNSIVKICQQTKLQWH